jgi:hypothetical protein
MSMVAPDTSWPRAETLRPTTDALPDFVPAPARVSAWRSVNLWRRFRDERRARAGECLRRIAAPHLAAGATLAEVAATLGVRPAGLAAAHATVFDPGESPLKARRLLTPNAVLRRVLEGPGVLVAEGRGWRAQVACGRVPATHGPAPDLACEPGLQLYALQTSDGPAALHWFDRRGAAACAWTPAVGHAAALDALVRAHGSVDLRLPSSTVAPGPAAVESTAGHADRTGVWPAGAGWDFLLLAASQALPLQVVLGNSIRLSTQAAVKRACLDGQSLRLDIGRYTLWLDEAAAWSVTDASGDVQVGAGLRFGLARSAAGAQHRAWPWLMAAVAQDQPVPACSC